MNKYWRHFKTITKHKFIVTSLCFKCGYIWRGLTHDLSKYTPTEFFSSARYFQGNRSPIDAEKEAVGYSKAWLHHKGHNPHHWEYWIDYLGTYENKPAKIPFEYVVEMMCDWIAASIVYSKVECDYNKPFSIPYDYYQTVKTTRIFHKDTEKLIDCMLYVIKSQSVSAFCEAAKSFKDWYEQLKGE